MHYLVTGGAGFIGSHLADELSRKHEVTILDNLVTGKRENILHLVEDEKVIFIEGSVTDYPLLYEICSNVDGVFHQAAQTYVQKSIENPHLTHEVNLTGTLNVLLASRDAGVGNVVCASSAAVYGNRPEIPKKEDMAPDPLSPYATTKLASEYYGKVFTELYGLQTVFLRYFNVFGPRQDPESAYAAVIPKFIACMLNGEPPVIFGDGNQTRDFIYVRDVVQANMRAMQRDVAGVFNIARGECTSLNNLVSILGNLMDVKPLPIHEVGRPGDVRHSQADITKARAEFGFEPLIGMETGLSETIRSLREWGR